jgi:hypothetical protein
VLSELCPVEGAELKDVAPTKKRAPHQRFEVPEGWVARGFSFEVEWPEGDRASVVRSHLGARRFAFNWALGQVKSDMDARKVDPGHVSVPWDPRRRGRARETLARTSKAAPDEAKSRKGTPARGAA